MAWSIPRSTSRSSRCVQQKVLFRNVLNIPVPIMQTIYLVRHGQSEMNVFLRDCYPGYGEPGWVDPLLFDTYLTERGRSQATKLALQTAQLSPAPELLVVSPLTRALDTALLAFPPKRNPLPRVVHHLARERCYMSSDMGRPLKELQEEYAQHDWSVMEAQHGPDDVWWGPPTAPGELESKEDLEARAEGLRQWIEARPERCVALVSHAAVLQALTGMEFRNCEMQHWRTDRLKARPWLLNKLDTSQVPM